MDELSKSVPGAESMVDAENSTPRKSGNEFCLNCGTKLLDSYCYHCGQKDIPRRQTLGELWENFISSFWSFEGKFFRTTKFLILKPGFLAIEYNKGHRESYYHPARMYAFISFVFFLVFFSLPDKKDDDDDKGDNIEITNDKEAQKKQIQDSLSFTSPQGDSVLKKMFSREWIDSVKKASKANKKNKKNAFSIAGEKYSSRAEYDSIQATKEAGKRDGWFKKMMIVRIIELNKRYGNDTTSFGKEFEIAFRDNFSKILFFLLPFFALTLKLLYVRRDYFYSEHLVFSIYYYNFAYLGATVQILLSRLPQEWPSAILGFWIYFYLMFAMKRMYQQSWKKTIAKFFLFSLLFLVVFTIAFLIAAVAILMVM